MPRQMHSEDSSSASSHDDPPQDACYLIRVPKSINVKELQHYQLDLAAYGLSDSVVGSKSEPERVSFGHSLQAPGAANAAQVTLLRGQNNQDEDQDSSLSIDPSFHLAGCINFYAYRTMPDGVGISPLITPLLTSCPNEPIEVIVNRARGHSGRRKRARQSQHSQSSPSSSSACTTTIEPAEPSRSKRLKRK